MFDTTLRWLGVNGAVRCARGECGKKALPTSASNIINQKRRLYTRLRGLHSRSVRTATKSQYSEGRRDPRRFNRAPPTGSGRLSEALQEAPTLGRTREVATGRPVGRNSAAGVSSRAVVHGAAMRDLVFINFMGHVITSRGRHISSASHRTTGRPKGHPTSKFIHAALRVSNRP